MKPWRQALGLGASGAEEGKTGKGGGGETTDQDTLSPFSLQGLGGCKGHVFLDLLYFFLLLLLHRLPKLIRCHLQSKDTGFIKAAP